MTSKPTSPTTKAPSIFNRGMVVGALVGLVIGLIFPYCAFFLYDTFGSTEQYATTEATFLITLNLFTGTLGKILFICFGSAIGGIIGRILGKNAARK